MATPITRVLDSYWPALWPRCLGPIDSPTATGLAGTQRLGKDPSPDTIAGS